MTDFVWLYIAFGVIGVLAIVYLVLIAPTKNRKIKGYGSVLYAHRGLHGDGVAENSMTAFRLAVEREYGIELDIRLSRDGRLVVFHDDTLERVAGVEGRVDSYTAEELSKIRLLGTEDTVPLFSDVLKLVAGKVPLLVEIKEDAGKYGVSNAAAEMLGSYTGPYIIESFNPLSLGNVSKKLPDVPRGILSQNYMREKKYRKPLYFALGALLLNRVCKPSFIAYNHVDYRSLSLRIARRIFGAVTFAWTVRSAEEERCAKAHGFDGIIFEGYIPEEDK